MQNNTEKLNELAIKYGTDKMLSKHGYVREYAKLFSKFENDNVKLLEIGVREGWSHQMWYDYFQNGTIYGIDIDTNCKSIENDRIKIEIGDQGDTGFINQYCVANGPFEIIIDDGSHMIKHQILCFNELFKYVKSGGYYIIEELVFNINFDKLLSILLKTSICNRDSNLLSN